MPVTVPGLTSVRLLVPLCLALTAAMPASAQHFWNINALPVSGEITGTARPYSLAQVPDAQDDMPAALAQTTPDATGAGDAEPPQVDESALRYFARQGDTRRLEIEIARLRALYPTWTPPADPLAAPVNIDERLEAIWVLYSQGRFAEARQAIAARQAAEPDWTPPADLLDRLALAEARERLVNASQIDQYETVIRIASENPHLLTCAEVDVLWRVAEAFARTERPQRARDAYRYVLATCDDPQERLATMQNAAALLPDATVSELLDLERVGDDGVGEFVTVRDNLARDAVAAGGEDAATAVPAAQLSRLERLAREERLASDARLLGWYHIQRENFPEAENWFRMAQEEEESADAAEGLALALIARDQHAEAEAVLHRWRDDSDNTRRVYLAAAANLLATEPRPVLPQEVLARIVAEVATARDAAAGQQLGWYARAWEQHQTAGQWFATVLGWSPDDEPSAYGLALTRHLLGDSAGLAEIKRQWAGRSERIQQVGTGITEAAPVQPSVPRPAEPRPEQAQPTPPAAAAPAAPPRQATPRAATATAATRQSCDRHVNPQRLSPEAALRQGWCLMDANRPLEAANAFAVALNGDQRTRSDAAWGQSLAYLRAELVDEAAVAAASAPQSAQRAGELQTAILAQRAVGAYQNGRYVEALIALDQRARIAPERLDLMVLRGYAYLNLRRASDARRVFEAVAATGHRDGMRGLAAVRSAMESAE